MSEINELPNGWVCFSLGDITTKNTKKATPEQLPDARFVGMDCIEANSLRPHKYYSFKDFKSSGNCFENNQVLYGRMRPYLNKVFLASFEGVCSGEFIVLNCLEAFYPDYLQYILHGREFVRFANSKTSGDRPRITFEEIATFPIKLPPVPEQHRIVSKIEELFSSLDKGVESLKTARQQLKVYRQAVLKWAFEGRLTNENVVDGELPEGWSRTHTGKVLETINNGYTPKKEFLFENSGEVPFIKVYNLNFDGTLNFKKNPTFIPRQVHLKDLKRSICVPGDVLINIVGPPLGKVSIVPNDYPEWNINQAIVVFRPNEKVTSKYLAYFMQNHVTIQWLENTSKATAGQWNVKVSTCREIPISIPGTLTEQQAIVSEIESRLSVCDKIEESITQSLLQAEALRQSILKKAFEGKLVSQDPADEPARVLLERIKAERLRVPAPKKSIKIKMKMVKQDA